MPTPSFCGAVLQIDISDLRHSSHMRAELRERGGRPSFELEKIPQQIPHVRAHMRV
jgi:hypothetical protein